MESKFALNITSYLSIGLSKTASYSKTIKDAKKLLVFGETQLLFETSILFLEPTIKLIQRILDL